MTLLTIARCRYPGLVWSVVDDQGREALRCANPWRGKGAVIYTDIGSAEQVVEWAAKHVGMKRGQTLLPTEVGS